MSFPANCPTWLDCTDGRQNLTTDQLFRLLVIEDENGCPAIRTNSTGGSGSGVEREPDIIVTYGAGNTVANLKSVSFYNSGATNVTVKGQILKPSVNIDFAVINPNDYLKIIPYDASGGELTISTLL